MSLFDFIGRRRNGNQIPGKRASHKRTGQHERILHIERLEPRLMLYAATGNEWPHPEVVTISIVPDGTNLGGVTSNLNAAFESNPRLAGQWQTQILRAAQVWAQQTNINFVLITDSGAASGSGAYQQGDPTMGDIRIGGYAFDTSTLARAYAPPPANNFSLAGDIAFNTAVGFNIGSTYDLFTVAAHEFGHALGLDHTSAGTAPVMYSSYNGVKSSLTSDDIAGIRSIYSDGGAARAPDAYDAAAANNSFAAATDISSTISPSSKTALLQNLDITTTSDTDYYKVTAPAGTSGNMVVTVQSAGLSLLASAATIYASDRTTVLRAGSALGQYGATQTFTVNNVVPGATYYIKVRGADSSAFGTGSYALTLNFGTGASPTVPVANTATPNGSPLSGSGGLAEGRGENDTFLDALGLILGLTPDTGASNTDGVTSTRLPVLSGAAPDGYHVELFDNGISVGSALSVGDRWSITPSGSGLKDGRHSFVLVTTDELGRVTGSSNPLSVMIDSIAPSAPSVTGLLSTSGLLGSLVSSLTQPLLGGLAEASSVVTVSCDGSVMGTTTADAYGKWQYSLPSGLLNGAFNFTATATDLAGNVSKPSGLFTLSLGNGLVSVSAPVLASASDTGVVGDNLTSLLSPTLVGTATAGSVVTVYDGSTALGTTVADWKGAWSFTCPTLTQGLHSLRAQASGLLSTSSLSGALDLQIQ